MNGNYDYQYSFSVKDELVPRYSYRWEHRGGRYTPHLFEVETVFIIKRRDGQPDENIGSETYDSVFHRNPNNPEREKLLRPDIGYSVSFRLKDYLAGPVLVHRFNSDAAHFIVGTERASQTVIPIHVKFKVVTLQRQWETIEQTRDRAVGPDLLVPITLYPFSSHIDRISFDISRSNFLLMKLPKVRVYEDHVVDDKEVCGICSRLPNIATQITTLPDCKHVFHYHCIVRWLWEYDLCPKCNSVAYHVPEDAWILPPQFPLHASQ